jgi:hypothetical protein
MVTSGSADGKSRVSPIDAWPHASRPEPKPAQSRYVSRWLETTTVITMRGTLIPVIAVDFAALIVTGPNPAAAAPASAALADGESNVGVVEQVGRKYRYSRKWRRGPYYRGYAYRPYGYWGGPYAHGYGYGYGYGWPYYRRGPGVSLWLGF